MELLFRNKRGTKKLCMSVEVEDIMKLDDKDIDKLKEILELNAGYNWQPVSTGYAAKYNLPLIKA